MDLAHPLGEEAGSLPRCTAPYSVQPHEGRLGKVKQLAAVARDVADLADEAPEVSDAYVTLLVHAGIAAADVICCARLGEYAQGSNHNEAIALLKKADPDSARHLETLLKM